MGDRRGDPRSDGKGDDDEHVGNRTTSGDAQHGGLGERAALLTEHEIKDETGDKSGDGELTEVCDGSRIPMASQIPWCVEGRRRDEGHR